MEIWKDVVGYEDIYEVSNTGKIRTVKGKTTFTALHGKRTWKQRELKQKVSVDNTHRVELWKDGKSRTWLVHRVVALAFLDGIDGKNYINHIDGNRNNNHISNLEWCNHKENNNHAFDNDLIGTATRIVLENIKSGYLVSFRSMAKASEYIGRNHTYVCNKLKKGINTIDGYRVYIHKHKEVKHDV